MPHDIYDNKFVAIRQPAWHRLGVTFPEPILPSQAVREAQLDAGAEVAPLYVMRPSGKLIDTKLISIGRLENDDWVSYGVGSQFTILPLSNVLPTLDNIATDVPLDAAGTLRKGGEIFFTFKYVDSEICGEEYNEYLVYRHSYTPGVAQMIMWTPVRVVCQNTLVFGAAEATSKLNVAHDKNVEKITNLGLKVFGRLLKQSEKIKTKLEALAKHTLSKEDTENVLNKVYSVYTKNQKIDLSTIGDLIPNDEIEPLEARIAASQRYTDSLKQLTRFTYEKLNDETPRLANTAYNLYQAVVEVADFRVGRRTAVESAVVGSRAAEKTRAWETLTALVALN